MDEEAVRQVAALIEALPTAEEYSALMGNSPGSEDEKYADWMAELSAAKVAIREAVSAYNALNDAEKDRVEPELSAKLEDLIRVLRTGMLRDGNSSNVMTEENNIYANGAVLVITQGNSADTTTIYVDANDNGEKDSDESLVIQNEDLSQYTIYGGSKSGNVSSTKVTMTGGKIKEICGGGEDGIVNDGTKVIVSGGEVTNLYGGGANGVINGGTEVIVSDGTITNIYGGSGGLGGDIVNGGTKIKVSGGMVTTLYGGGFNGVVNDGVVVNVSGGMVEQLWGGGNSGTVNGDRIVTIGGAARVGSFRYEGIFINDSNNNYPTTGVSSFAIDPDLKGEGKIYIWLPSNFNTTVATSAVQGDLEHLELKSGREGKELYLDGTDVKVRWIYTISGTIKGSDTENGIAASIQLKNTNGNVGSPVTANSDGSYTITHVAPGTYSIEVSCAGYSKGTIDGIEVRDSNVADKDLTLEKAPETPPAGGAGNSSGSDGSSSGSGSGSSLDTTTSATSTTTTPGATTQTEDGGTITSTTTTSITGTTVETQVKKDATGQVTGATAQVTAAAVASQGQDGQANVEMKVDASAIAAAAMAAGTTVQVDIKLPTETIKEQLANPQNQSLHVDVQIPSSVAASTAAPVTDISLDKEAVETAKGLGKDITITIKDENGNVNTQWTFGGEDLKNSQNPVSDVNLAVWVVPVKTLAENKEDIKVKVSGITGMDREQTAGLNIDFSHSGLLPSMARILIPAGNDAGIMPGDTVYLYYYNPAAKQLETLEDNQYDVDGEGFVTVRLNHCSDYVLIPVR